MKLAIADLTPYFLASYYDASVHYWVPDDEDTHGGSAQHPLAYPKSLSFQ